jgi:hypothetical protein
VKVQQTRPDSALKKLGDAIVGSWRLSGDATGQIRFEWLDGGFFLVQHVDIEHGGRSIKGIEVIGHLQRPGEEPGKEIRSRFYSALDCLTLDYVYELVDDTLFIHFGEKESNNFYKATFGDGGNTMTGAWQWPGGGYKVVGRRE